MAHSKATHTFTVEGTGEFPFDMLRYDACWTNSSEDAYKLQSPYTSDEKRGVRRVTLATAFDTAPTRRRWESFTWRIV